MIILGMDPGIASFGAALIRVREDESNHPTLSLIDLTVFSTTPDKNAASVAEDLSRRARYVARSLWLWLQYHGAQRPGLAAAERYTPPRASKTEKSMGVIKGIEYLSRGWGIVDAMMMLFLLESDLVEFCFPSPKKIKSGVTGLAKKATKGDVQEALMQLFGATATTGRLRAQGVQKAKFEHAFDALGAAVVSVPGDPGPMFRTAI